MTGTAPTFPDPDMPIITDLSTKSPKTNDEITYLEKENIDEATRKNMRKNYVYKTDMHKIYNLIVGQTNEQTQEKTVSYATFQVVKID